MYVVFKSCGGCGPLKTGISQQQCTCPGFSEMSSDNPLKAGQDSIVTSPASSDSKTFLAKEWQR